MYIGKGIYIYRRINSSTSFCDPRVLALAYFTKGGPPILWGLYFYASRHLHFPSFSPLNAYSPKALLLPYVFHKILPRFLYSANIRTSLSEENP